MSIEENISENDYAHVKTVWEKYKVKAMEENQNLLLTAMYESISHCDLSRLNPDEIEECNLNVSTSVVIPQFMKKIQNLVWNCALRSASDVVFDCCAHVHIGREWGGRRYCQIEGALLLSQCWLWPDGSAQSFKVQTRSTAPSVEGGNSAPSVTKKSDIHGAWVLRSTILATTMGFGSSDPPSRWLGRHAKDGVAFPKVETTEGRSEIRKLMLVQGELFDGFECDEQKSLVKKCKTFSNASIPEVPRGVPIKLAKDPDMRQGTDKMDTRSMIQVYHHSKESVRRRSQVMAKHTRMLPAAVPTTNARAKSAHQLFAVVLWISDPSLVFNLLGDCTI
uniref:Uncharacterized protein n=1 Tax=Timema shepardi TaxID=629360 RepID=A0A7R9ASW5_TIMSH|nr:unnamed protein product [Timema shepardi]